MTRKITPSGARGEEYELRQEWPEDALVQAGVSGLVLSRDGSHYTTAFFEAFPTGTFIRGEARTLEEAEIACWIKFKLSNDCPEHEWRPYPKGRPNRPYRNGAGFCQRCNRFEGSRFTGEQLGQLCVTCGAGTTWGRYGPEARWDDDSFLGVVDPSPEEAKVWYCEKDSPFIEERLARRERELARMRAHDDAIAIIGSIHEEKTYDD